MKIIEELKKLSDEQVLSAEKAREICTQKKLIWTFKECKEKHCKYTYRQKFHCGIYGCVHNFAEWTQNHVPFEDRYEEM